MRSAGSVPDMAHIPLIHGPDGSKLSKRHGALGVDAYRAMGYLPAALRNYLVRLGWAHGDQEIILHRGNDRSVRPAADRTFAGALRFRQAREPQRPLHARKRDADLVGLDTRSAPHSGRQRPRDAN